MKKIVPLREKDIKNYGRNAAEAEFMTENTTMCNAGSRVIVQGFLDLPTLNQGKYEEKKRGKEEIGKFWGEGAQYIPEWE